MDTILNIPEAYDEDVAAAFPGDFSRPPPAKCVEPATITFADVSKPEPVPDAKPCRLWKWALVCLVAVVLVTTGLFVFMEVQEGSSASHELITTEDPLNDLMRIFVGQGIEPSDNACMACFFSDPGRVRKADGATEAFIVYRTENAINFFEVVTHVFNPPSDFPASEPVPFSFWSSGDENHDGEPDLWQPLEAQYRKIGSAMGWEKGAFFNAVPLMPFLKITFHDMEGSWRPQIGNVVLVPPVDGIATDTEPEDVDATAAEGDLELPELANTVLEHPPVDLLERPPVDQPAADPELSQDQLVGSMLVNQAS